MTTDPLTARLCDRKVADLNVPDQQTRTLERGKAAQLPAGADHYRAFVGPPNRFDFMGTTQLALLFALGLRDGHRVLDVGCGSLRLGRLLIPFLQPDRYFGIEPNLWLIEDALDHELGRDILTIKRPTFSQNQTFATTGFGVDFDFVVAQSILTHCGEDWADALITAMAKPLAPTGKILFSIAQSAQDYDQPHRGGWVYPDCVTYGPQTMVDLCAAHGLKCQRLPWYHPELTWYLAARSERHLVPDQHLPLLQGAVLFDPQFADSYLP